MIMAAADLHEPPADSANQPKKKVHSPPISCLPAALQRALRNAFAAEAEAQGAERRDAFRTTRNLLAGCRAAGVPLTVLAEFLDVRAGSLRARSAIDGVIPAATFAKVSGISLEEIDRWQQRGLLPPPTLDEQQSIGYPASTLVNALQQAPPVD